MKNYELKVAVLDASRTIYIDTETRKFSAENDIEAQAMIEKLMVDPTEIFLELKPEQNIEGNETHGKERL